MRTNFSQRSLVNILVVTTIILEGSEKLRQKTYDEMGLYEVLLSQVWRYPVGSESG